MQNQNTPSREIALDIIAKEIDKVLKIGPVVHIKHRAVLEGQHRLACLESHLLGHKDGQLYTLHDWAHYDGDAKATSIAMPEAPRGFTITLKTDSWTENKLRGTKQIGIPLEAKTPNYTGDYVKIDWIYPHKEIQGLGIPRLYFFAVERGAKAAGYPSLHIDATNNGLSYWARKEFNLKISEDMHTSLKNIYQLFKADAHTYIQQARHVSPYVNMNTSHGEELPRDIDPSKPYSIPRIFMDILSTIFRMKGEHLHFYKKFRHS